MHGRMLGGIKDRFQAVIITACFIFGAAEGMAVVAPTNAPLLDFDKRQATVWNPSASRQTALKTLKAQAGDIEVEFDPLLKSAKSVSRPAGFLTGANGQGTTISASTLSALNPGQPYKATKAFLTEHKELFGHGAEVLDEARISREYTASNNGLHTVVWEQQVDGIPLFESVLISHVTKRGELVNLASQFIPNPNAAALAGTPNKAALARSPALTARRAIVLAGQQIGESLDEQDLREAPLPDGSLGGSGPRLEQHFDARVFKGDAEAKLLWLPLGPDKLRLCWDVTVMGRTRGEMFSVLLDAETSELWVRRCRTFYISDITLRVYTNDSPSPFSPGWPTPNANQPPLVPRVLVTLSALDTNASPSGWIDDGGNETRGNNVDAHTDKNADNAADLPRPQGSPSRVFDFAMDLNQEPATYTNAAVVQLFYWNNYIHDRLYQLGFTEAAGNFQSNNFGRGGVANDAVQADAQDGSGFNNANFSVVSDGTAGRMQMYLFNGPTPDRDGDFDADVVLHEYTHGLSNRRVGGGVLISALQTRGMGEGWSDFFALSLLSQAGDDVNGCYAAGGYASFLFGGETQNYYFGIRRYPYCTDTNKNPLTFKDIDPNQASAHSGIPRNSAIGTTANEAHNMGEVWCNTLWGARANIVTKYGWEAGNQLMLQLVTDGMGLSPANPTFLQARNAILQADMVDTGGVNQFELWSAFAKRGMGYSATSPASGTTTGLFEAYDVPIAPLVLIAPTNAAEGDGVLIGAGHVRIPSALGTNVTFSLSSSNVSEATVPATVSIIAGETNASFDITIVDDAVLDGTQSTELVASAPGFAKASVVLYVADNESTTLHVSAPANVSEGQGIAQGSVQLDAAPISSVVVSLGSSDTGEIQVPRSVAIPPGQTSGIFTITIVDNAVIDGPRNATVTAHVQNWVDGAADITVQDNEAVNLTLALPATAAENGGVLANAASVRLAGTTTTNLVISLASSSTDRLQVPATVTVLAGASNAAFDLVLIDNNLVDSNQTVTITAFAPGFIGTNGSLLVLDDESPSVPANPHPGDLAINVPANTNLTWESGGIGITNDIYLGTNPSLGPAQLQGSTTGTTWTLPLLAPATTYYWQIVAHKNGTTAGPVWRFTTRGVDHFDFASIPSPELAGQPFNVTIAAKDSFGRTVTNFAGSATIGVPVGGERLHADFESGLQGFTISNSFGRGNGLWHISTGRGSNAGHSPVTSLYYGTNEMAAGGGTYSNGVANSGVVVSSPIALPAGTNLLSYNYLLNVESGSTFDQVSIEVSTDNGASFAVVAAKNTSGLLTNNTSGLWISNTVPLTQFSGKTILLRFRFDTVDSISNGTEGWYLDDIVIKGGGVAIGLVPTNSGPFINGIWEGSVTMQDAATNISILADDGQGHTGTSNPFDVLVLNDVAIAILDSPDPVSAGSNLTYTLTVANGGPANATAVVVSNLLPSGVTFVSATASQGTVTQNGGIVTAQLGTIAGGANSTVSIVVVPQVAAVTLTNLATVSRSEPDPVPSNNSAVALTTVGNAVLSIADTSVIEGDFGTTNVAFAVTLNAPSAKVVFVTFATANGSAQSGTDYAATTGTLSIPIGATNGTILIPVLGDTSVESDETFFVNLSSPGNAVIGRGQAAATILDDDGVPGRLHHFAWNPIASPQYAGVPFAVSVSARDAFDNPATNALSGVSLRARNALDGVFLFRDNFEDGSFSDWSNGSDAVTRAITTETAAGGTHSFTITGGVFNHYGGIYHLLTNTQPARVIFYVKTATTAAGGYFVLADATSPAATTTEDTAVFFFMTGGTMCLSASTIAFQTPCNTLQWYKIELRFNWTAHTVDFYRDDVLMTAGFPFRGPVNKLGIVHLYNYENTQAWWDEIQMDDGIDTSPFVISPATTGPFSDGAWSGVVTVSPPGTNVVLTADDNAGHVGSSNPFNLLAAPLKLQIEEAGNNSFRLSLAGLPDRVYRIQYTENLLTPLWQDLYTNTVGPLGVLEYLDSPPPGTPARFYRSVSP